MVRVNQREIELGELLVRSIAEGLILDGVVDPRGKSDIQLQREVLGHVKRFVDNPRVGLIAAVDHTSTILKQARTYALSNDYELSCLFYATWFEHWLNHFIYSSLKRMKLTQQEITQIIREVQFRGKSTWLLRLLKLKAINKTHLGVMNNVSEARNAYVHYKWKAVDIDSDEWSEESAKNSLEGVEKTVRYLQRLANQQLFHGKKRSVIPTKMVQSKHRCIS